MSLHIFARAFIGAGLLSALALGASRAWGSRGATQRDGVVTVLARDYAFDAPDTVTAGVTTFHLVNRGPSLHHLWLVRLGRGKTADDFLHALQATPRMPSWAIASGGPNAPAPGNQSSATVVLAPGRYLFVCVVPGADHVSHAFKGMMRVLTVVAAKDSGDVGATGRQKGLRRADNVLTLHDYGFAFARAPVAGAQRIDVHNAATQPHEVELFRLPSGTALGDLVAWVRKNDGSPPPAKPIGGTAGLAPGLSTQVALTLERGEYALVCFWPDVRDGQPHVAHGMVARFTVR
jgi:uncharacterized cupredoxin-like copper-binding protein